MRSYSLSGVPSAERYRVSVKREAHGAAGSLHRRQAASWRRGGRERPRGSFTLRPGDAPIVFLSAGIGRPPYWRCSTRWRPLRRRGSLVAIRSPRSPRACFCRRGACPLKALRPRPQPHSLQLARSRGSPGSGFRRSGTPGHRCASRTGRAARCGLLCVRTARLHERSDRRPRTWGVAAGRIHTKFSAQVRPRPRGSPRRRGGRPTCQPGLPARDRWSRSPGAVSMSAGDRRFRACSSLPKRATYRCDGRAGPGSATPARPGWWPGP